MPDDGRSSGDDSLTTGALDAAWARERLLQRLPVAVAEVGPDGVIVTGNAEMAAVVGTDPRHLHGLDLTAVHWVDVAPVSVGGAPSPVPSPMSRVLAGEPVDDWIALTGLDGRRRSLRVRALPASPSEPVLLLMADVTEDLHLVQSHSAYSDIYRTVAEHLSDVVLVTEQETIVWVSPSVTAVLGYHPGTLIGRQISGLVVPQDRQDLQVTPQVPTMATQTRFQSADGTPHWVDARVTAEFLPDGSIGQVFHVLRDIHDQKLAEDRAGDVLMRKHAALDASPDGFAIYRADRDDLGRVSGLRLEFLNSAAIARSPGGAADRIGTGILDFYPQAAANGLWSDMITTLATGEQRARRLQDPHEGQDVVTDVVVGRLDQDTLVVTYRDTTEHARQQQELARALEELNRAQHTLRSALDAIDDGFSICDAVRGPDGEVCDLRITMINRAAAAVRGMTVEACQGSLVRKHTAEGTPHEVWDKAVGCLNDQQPRRFREEHGTFGEPGWHVRELTITPLSRDRVSLAGRDVTEDEHIRRVADLLRSRADQRDGEAFEQARRDPSEAPTAAAIPGPHDLTVRLPNASPAVHDQLGPICGPADLARCRARAQHSAPAHDLASRPICRRTHPISATTMDPLLARIDSVADQVRTWSPLAWELLDESAQDTSERQAARRFARACAHYAGRDGLLSYARSVIDLIAPATITSTTDSLALQMVHDALLAALTADLLDPTLAKTLSALTPDSQIGEPS